MVPMQRPSSRARVPRRSPCCPPPAGSQRRRGGCASAGFAQAAGRAPPGGPRTTRELRGYEAMSNRRAIICRRRPAHAGGLQPVENPDEFRHRVRPCPDTIAACARPRRALPARSSTLRPGPAQRPGAARFRSARFLHAARPEATTRASVQPLRYGLRVSRKSLPRGVGPHSPGRDRLCFSARHPRRFVYLLEHCIAPGTCPDLPR